ncbi:MAG: hypothetical protein ABUS79_05080, partial [Pseudomonadota bacterium]
DMLTAAITAAVAAVLSLFGIKPGPYLVGVAIGVKITIVLVSLLVGARLMRRRAAAKAPPPPDPTPK